MTSFKWEELPPEVRQKIAKEARVKTPKEIKLGVAARVLTVLTESGLKKEEQIKCLELVIKWLRGVK